MNEHDSDALTAVVHRIGERTALAFFAVVAAGLLAALGYMLKAPWVMAGASVLVVMAALLKAWVAWEEWRFVYEAWRGSRELRRQNRSVVMIFFVAAWLAGIVAWIMVLVVALLALMIWAALTIPLIGLTFLPVIAALGLQLSVAVSHYRALAAALAGERAAPPQVGVLLA